MIQRAVWLVLMALIMGWLARARLRPRAADDRHTLEHPVATLVTGLVSTAFFLSLTILSARASGPGRSSWAPFVLLALALLGAWLIVALCRERLQLEPGGLRYRRALGRSGALRWNEVAAASYSSVWKRFASRRRTVGSSARPPCQGPARSRQGRARGGAPAGHRPGDAPDPRGDRRGVAPVGLGLTARLG